MQIFRTGPTIKSQEKPPISLMTGRKLKSSKSIRSIIGHTTFPLLIAIRVNKGSNHSEIYGINHQLLRVNKNLNIYFFIHNKKLQFLN